MVRRNLRRRCRASPTFSFKPCWCGEWFGGPGRSLASDGLRSVSNLVGVESGSEACRFPRCGARATGFKPCWCGEWFGGSGFLAISSGTNTVSNLVGVESGSEAIAGLGAEYQVRSFKPCWCGEWFGGISSGTSQATGSSVSNLVGVESGSEAPHSPERSSRMCKFQTLLVWRVVRRPPSAATGLSSCSSFKPCWCGEWFGGCGHRQIRRPEKSFKPCWCGEWFGGQTQLVYFEYNEREFQTLLVWRVVRRPRARSASPPRTRCFKPCWCGEWFGGGQRPPRATAETRVSNLVGVESGSEGSSGPPGVSQVVTVSNLVGVESGSEDRLIMVCSPARNPVSNLVGVESGSEGEGGVTCWKQLTGFKPCWCGEWFGGQGLVAIMVAVRLFQTLLVWRVVRRMASLEALRTGYIMFQTLLVWRVVRREAFDLGHPWAYRFQTLLVWRVVRRSRALMAPTSAR